LVTVVLRGYSKHIKKVSQLINAVTDRVSFYITKGKTPIPALARSQTSPLGKTMGNAELMKNFKNFSQFSCVTGVFEYVYEKSNRKAR
jgi:hypothetical protein